MKVLNDAFWALDPKVTYLNHGSFGSCPRPVLDHQQTLRERLEREPMRFLMRDLEEMLDEAREALAKFINANPENLVFVPNATAGVNTVLRSLTWERGDELLTTNHVYNACGNALDFTAEQHGARVIVANVPFPLHHEDEVIEAVSAAITSKTKFALLDHVTSETGIILPINRLVQICHDHGVEVLVDGAHAPGMVDVDLEFLGAHYYTGNCHKWICAPKGSGFLYVKPENQKTIRPLSISHGANSPRTDRTRFQLEFGWTGTADPTAYLSVPEALRIMATEHADGWQGLIHENHERVVQGRQWLCAALELKTPCPERMLGSLASIPLPDHIDANHQKSEASPFVMDPLQDYLSSHYEIEVPVFPWRHSSARLIRVSSQTYNTMEDYDKLKEALCELNV